MPVDGTQGYVAEFLGFVRTIKILYIAYGFLWGGLFIYVNHQVKGSFFEGEEITKNISETAKRERLTKERVQWGGSMNSYLEIPYFIKI